MRSYLIWFEALQALSMVSFMRSTNPVKPPQRHAADADQCRWVGGERVFSTLLLSFYLKVWCALHDPPQIPPSNNTVSF